MIPDHPEITFREENSEYNNQDGIFLRDNGDHKYVIRLNGNDKELTVNSFHVFDKGTYSPVLIKVKSKSESTTIKTQDNSTLIDNIRIVFGDPPEDDERTKNHKKILRRMYPAEKNIDPDYFDY